METSVEREARLAFLRNCFENADAPLKSIRQNLGLILSEYLNLEEPIPLGNRFPRYMEVSQAMPRALRGSLVSNPRFPNIEFLYRQMATVAFFCASAAPNYQLADVQILGYLGVDVRGSIANGALLAWVREITTTYFHALRINGHPVLHYCVFNQRGWNEVELLRGLGADTTAVDTVWVEASQKERAIRPPLQHGTLLECAVHQIAGTGNWKGRWICQELLRRGITLPRDQRHQNLQAYIRAHIAALPSSPRHQYDFAANELNTLLRFTQPTT